MQCWGARASPNIHPLPFNWRIDPAACQLGASILTAGIGSQEVKGEANRFLVQIFIHNWEFEDIGR
jgi:hypothetical protein